MSNTLNKQLEELYNSKIDGIRAVKSELERAGINDYSSPLLLYVWEEDYTTAPVKLMIVGQETNGWFDADRTAENVTSAIEEYKKFDLGRNYNTTFWLWAHKINKLLGNPDTNSFVWNNILKYGRNDGKGAPDEVVTALENSKFNVIKEEIAILKPDVCIFLTGPNYDNKIVTKFPDVEMRQFNSYPEREVARLESVSLPMHSYRTYHPGFGQRNFDWYTEVFESIAKSVKQSR